ncbi:MULTISPECIES: aminotransferase class I/II-fold pyridoxal phosphate-dependent enzyme [unclassified Solwaraspora]|uniref:aminotransferase class I/II-fold pyridoxal phosphate-dependent enzyme n=1 Tax=unclassified Solwaraspora TaxID=2627926 RepID=UPI00248ADB08|nr:MULTISPECIES: aminotransferase class I/II-fold pyridoxal phosphate-dependent enzyme [unclassified Solwaraspora]WBB98644.1 aminotransferase class I/II-fold pyridoxal phosphate-dependent enzyme [Solwaraspora sp. WMMA2059]WBC22804.1 aminotransferase class I/II-fold pyridoxal phosphate-dependent enzyme [Solwaraspora sp. WMMA2080]WJK35155.1 aminotransferase class I/II-fold pyridoxal phosphate-dependent enzyme [Solwaraspora sp. WMMA2065]
MSEQYQPTGATATEISASVEAGVRTGALAPGALLPAVRTLADALEVSPATVAKAYQALRQRGIVDTDGRRGTRVRARPPVAVTRPGPSAPAPPGTLDLSTGEPDPRLLPPLATHLAAVARELADTASGQGYADAGLLPDLAALAMVRLADDGLPAGGLTVTSGALDGIERLLTGTLRPGDRVAVEDPGWANLLDLIAALGLTPVPMPVDDRGPTEPGLRAVLSAGVSAIVVTTRAQNPTGAALDADRADRLRRLLREADDVLLIEDDHAAELSDGPPHVLAGVTPRWAFVRSVSKPYGPDLRIALLTGDETTLSRVAGRMRIGSGWVSTVLQRLLGQLWRDPSVAATVAGAGRVYQRRRESLRAALANHGVASHGGSGINVWVPVTDETHVVAALQAAGFTVSTGARYRLRSAPGIRITVSGLDEHRAGELAAAVRDALRPAGLTGVGR